MRVRRLLVQGIASDEMRQTLEGALCAVPGVHEAVVDAHSKVARVVGVSTAEALIDAIDVVVKGAATVTATVTEPTAEEEAARLGKAAASLQARQRGRLSRRKSEAARLDRDRAAASLQARQRPPFAAGLAAPARRRRRRWRGV